MAENAVDDQDRMRDEERHEYRQQDAYRFLHPAQIQDQQQRDQHRARCPACTAPSIAGSRLNSASTPLATEMAIVST